MDKYLTAKSLVLYNENLVTYLNTLGSESDSWNNAIVAYTEYFPFNAQHNIYEYHYLAGLDWSSLDSDFVCHYNYLYCRVSDREEGVLEFPRYHNCLNSYVQEGYYNKLKSTKPSRYTSVHMHTFTHSLPTKKKHVWNPDMVRY